MATFEGEVLAPSDRMYAHVILITDGERYADKAIIVYSTIGRVVRSEDRIAEEDLANVTVLVVGLNRYIDAATLDRYPSLTYVVTPTTGLNHIDIDACADRGIRLLSLKGEAGFLDDITSTSELTLGLILALVRRIPPAIASVRAGMWRRELFRARQLSAMTLGIVGFGRIGKHVFQYARALRMRVIAYDPFLDTTSMARQQGIVFVDTLNALLSQSDIVTLHANYTRENEELIDERALNAMQPGTFLVNTARGELIDEAALVRALERGQVGGVAVDVLAGEQYGRHLEQSPLFAYAQTHDNVLITPHIGGCTSDAMALTEVFMAERLQQAMNEDDA